MLERNKNTKHDLEIPSMLFAVVDARLKYRVTCSAWSVLSIPKRKKNFIEHEQQQMAWPGCWHLPPAQFQTDQVE